MRHVSQFYWEFSRTSTTPTVYKACNIHLVSVLRQLKSRDIKMTSTVDSVINALEMDSCPDPPRTDNTRIAGTAGGFSAADSCSNRVRSDNTRIASAAGFSMSYPNAQSNRKDSPFYSLLDVRHIPPPPPPTMPHIWQYPEYRTFASRYATFQNWPKYLRGPSKTDLARAGFIYTQYGDRVTCFCCGMTLSEWEPVDDAYREHLRWSRYCHFAQTVGSM